MPKNKQENPTLTNVKHKIRHTIEDAFEDFIKYHCKATGLRPDTIAMHHERMTYFISYLQMVSTQPPKYLDQVSGQICREYVYYMLYEHKTGNTLHNDGLGVKPTTVESRLKSLRAQFNWYVKTGRIEQNPWLEVEKLKIDKEPKAYLTESEVARLLSIPDQTRFASFRNYVTIAVMLDTGIRVSECFRLKESDFDLEVGMVNVPASVSKTRVPRSMPLCGRTVRLLTNLFSWQAPLKDRSPYAFISETGEQLTKSSLRKALLTYSRKANISKPVSPHTLRRTMAHHYIANGGDPYSLMSILGHTEIETTLHYVNMDISSFAAKHEYLSPISQVKLIRNMGGNTIHSLRNQRNPYITAPQNRVS